MDNEKKSCCCGTPAQTVPEAAAESCCPAAADTEGAACCRHKDRTPEEHKALLNRLSRIEGQVRGIRGMLEKDVYCVDILVQVAAANSALNSFSKELLAQHISTCVADDLRAGRQRRRWRCAVPAALWKSCSARSLLLPPAQGCPHSRRLFPAFRGCRAPDPRYG